ncbi:hypothetical protein MXB_4960, partial [Myxobolus squamalis]
NHSLALLVFFYYYNGAGIGKISIVLQRALFNNSCNYQQPAAVLERSREFHRFDDISCNFEPYELSGFNIRESELSFENFGFPETRLLKTASEDLKTTSPVSVNKKNTALPCLDMSGGTNDKICFNMEFFLELFISLKEPNKLQLMFQNHSRLEIARLFMGCLESHMQGAVIMYQKKPYTSIFIARGQDY